jgi:hypothetical protein
MISNMSSSDSVHFTFGVVCFGILGNSLFLQVCIMVALVRVPLWSKDALLTAVGCGPALMVWRTLFGKEERRFHSAGLPSAHVLVVLQIQAIVLESFPELFLGAFRLARDPVERWSTLQLSTVFSSLLGIVFTLTIVVTLPSVDFVTSGDIT